MMETKTYKKFKDSPVDNFPKMIIVHHSGGTDANPLADTSKHTAEMMEAYHLSLSWEGLGYQYVIHFNGDIWKGRPETFHGAHTVGQNANSIGICLAGNFDATLPTKEQEQALVSLISDIQTRYPLIVDQVYPHRKFAKKTCYGNKLGDNWALELIKMVPVKDYKDKIKEVILILQGLL